MLIMVCPNIKNKQVVKEFNEIIEAFGGKPMTEEEFKNKELRNLREGVDYAAMEMAYHVWHKSNGNGLELAPNGADSKLFLDLLLLNNGNRIAAIKIKSNMYSSDNTYDNIDENGEPSANEVISKGLMFLINPNTSKQIELEIEDHKRLFIEGVINDAISYFNNNHNRRQPIHIPVKYGYEDLSHKEQLLKELYPNSTIREKKNKNGVITGFVIYFSDEVFDDSIRDLLYKDASELWDECYNKIAKLIIVDQVGENVEYFERFGIRYQINPKNKQQIVEQVVKKAIMTRMEDILESFEFLESLPKSRENDFYVECCIRWLKNGTISLPRDNEKIRPLFDYARAHNIDLQTVKNPILLIQEEYKRTVISVERRPVDMSKRQRFSYNRTEEIKGQLVEIYDVEDSEEGQLAVCQLLADTNPIKLDGTPQADFSPWCLSTYHYNNDTKKATPTSSATVYWGKYNKGKRQIAICNGVPVAFNSSSKTKDEWWDWDDGRNNGFNGFESISDIDIDAFERIFKNMSNNRYHSIQTGNTRYILDENGNITNQSINFNENWIFVHSAGDISIHIDSIKYVNFHLDKSGDGLFNLGYFYKNSEMLSGDYNDQLFVAKNLVISRLCAGIAHHLISDEYEHTIPTHLELRYKNHDGKPYLYKIKLKNRKLKLNTSKLEEFIKKSYINGINDPNHLIDNVRLFKELKILEEILQEIQSQILQYVDENVTEDTLEVTEIDTESSYKSKKNRSLNSQLRRAIVLSQRDYSVEDFNLNVEQALNPLLNANQGAYGPYNTTTEDGPYNAPMLEENIQLAIIEEHNKLNLAARFNKLVTKPMNEDLESILLDILKEYNFSIIEGPLKEVFGKDIVGAFDCLQKIIYLAKGGDRNALTLPEEFSHAFIKMMGAVYHKPENRDKFKETKLYSELRDLIEKTDLYKQTFERYKDVYTRKDGSIDYPALKEETLGKALAVYLHDAQQRKDEKFFKKLKIWFERTIRRIKSFFKKLDDLDKLDSELTKIAESIIKGSFRLKYLRKLDSKDFRKITYDETIQHDIVINNGFGIELMKFFSDLGCIIAGSVSYRQQGDLFRSDVDQLHDFDISVPLRLHNIHVGRPALSRDRNGYDQNMIIEAIRRTPAAMEMIRKVKERYPNLLLISAFSSNGDVVTNWMICEDESIVERFKNMTGNFNHRLSQFTQEERDKIKLLDLFFNGHNDIESDYITDDRGIKLAHYKHSFSKKLQFSRAKDLYDYQQWKPYNRMPLSIPNSNILFLMNPTNNSNGSNTVSEALTSFLDIKNMIGTRLSSEKRKKVDAMKEAIFQTMHDQFVNAYENMFEIDEADRVTNYKDPDFINGMFKQLVGTSGDQITFLNIAIEEIDEAISSINEIKEGSDTIPSDVLYFIQNVIGYYLKSIKHLEDFINNDIVESSGVDVDKLQLARILTNELKAKIVSLDFEISKIAEKYIDNFIDKYVDTNVFDGDPNIFKLNIKYWMKNSLGLNKVELIENFAGNPSTSSNPLILLVWHFVRQEKRKITDPVQEAGKELVKLLNEIQGHGITNFQRRFCETDKDGKTTGYYIDYVNRGLYYTDIRNFEERLQKRYEKEGKGYFITEDGERVFKFKLSTNPNENYELDFEDELDDYRDTLSNRRFKAAYYKARRRILSKDTIIKIDGIDRQINAILNRPEIAEKKTIHGVERIIHREDKLTNPQKLALNRLREQKKQLKELYIEIKDPITGEVVLHVKKKGRDLEIAIELNQWDYVKNKHIKYESDWDKYYTVLNELLNEYGVNSDEVKEFEKKYYINRAIGSKFYDALSALFNSKNYSPEDAGQILALRAEYAKIKLKALFNKGFSYLDFSKFTDEDWAHMKRLDELIEEINKKYGPSVPVLDKKDLEETLKQLAVFESHPHLVNGKVIYKQYTIRETGQTVQRLYSEYEYLGEMYGNDLLLSKYSYEHVDKDENPRIVPLSVFSFTKPVGEHWLSENVSGEYSKLDLSRSSWVNHNFDETDLHTTQPMVNIYENEKYYDLTAKEKQFLEKIKEVMYEANKCYGLENLANPLQMPQIHAEAESIMFRNGKTKIGQILKNIGLYSTIGAGIGTVFSPGIGTAIGAGIGGAVGAVAGKTINYAIKHTFDIDESDDYQIKHQDPDQKYRGSVPVKYRRMLKDPENISTDVIGTVIAYYLAAKEFEVLSSTSTILELMKHVMNNYETSTMRFDLILDNEVYGIKLITDGNTGKRLDKIAQVTASTTAKHLLALNLNSIVKGMADAIGSNLVFTLSDQFWGLGDLHYARTHMLFDFINGNAVRSVGKVRRKSLGMALMDRLEIDESFSSHFKDTHFTWGKRVFKDWRMMLQRFVDYFNTSTTMFEVLSSRKLVYIPKTRQKVENNLFSQNIVNMNFEIEKDEHGNDIMTPMFCTKEQAIQLLTRAYPGISRKEAMKKYNAEGVCLFDAYELVDGYAKVKDEYKHIVTPELEGTVRSGIVDISALINGMKSEGSRTSYIKRVPFLGALLTTRGFMESNLNERFKHGSSFLPHEDVANGIQQGGNKKPSKTKKINRDKLSVSEQLYYDNYTMAQYNFGMSLADIGSMTATAKTGLDIMSNLLRFCTNVLCIAIGKDKKTYKNINRLQIKKLQQVGCELMLIAIPAVMLCTFGPMLLSCALGGGDDDDSYNEENDTFENKTKRWFAARTLLLISGNLMERSTFYSPETFGDLLDTPSTQYTWLKTINYFTGAGECLSSFNAMSELYYETLGVPFDENNYYYDYYTGLPKVRSGAYKGKTKLFRDVFKTVNATGLLPLDNIYKSLTVQGSLSTFKYYNSNTNPNKWVWKPESYSNPKFTHRKGWDGNLETAKWFDMPGLWLEGYGKEDENFNQTYAF